MLGQRAPRVVVGGALPPGIGAFGADARALGREYIKALISFKGNIGPHSPSKGNIGIYKVL